ncbi:MAG TPA: pilus assembly PilX N-terminal domain-containing protein [Candidatus Acidoferrum sp.]|nr:pilus assembly PilX N-terminal domain-containing protein [Candidatus Acidoferrum sp.]
MKKDRKTRRRTEEGIALLIAIFVLLLISVVAIALLVSSGTETALGANYRASSTVYYAALAGLEEARGRMLPKNPNYFGAAVIPTPFPLGQTVYVLNRLSGEVIAPWDPSNNYYDKEYYTEFGTQASSAAYQSVNSVWDNNVQGIPGPLFKWVRINAVSDAALHTEINYSTGYHPSTAVYFDPAHVDYNGNPWPSMIEGPTATAQQVLEITALAALPNGSEKYLQYVVASTKLNLGFPAALTFSGTNIGGYQPPSLTPPPGGASALSVPTSPSFEIDGNDSSPVATPDGCTPGPTAVSAIGYSTNAPGDTSQSNIMAAIATPAPGNPSKYKGIGGTTPNVNYVGPLLAANLQTVGGLNLIVQTLSQHADAVLDGTVTAVTQSQLPAWMSATNPATIVVNGDLNVTSWHGTGYGVLLVTGQFTYDPDAYWNGIVLVIGKGIMYSSMGGIGQLNGAVFLARTLDAANNPLPSSSAPGSSTFDFTAGSGSEGLRYSSCWVKYVQTPLSYKILAFHEVPQP